MAPDSIAFLFDGKRIQPTQTAIELAMEDEDEIDAMLHQVTIGHWGANPHHESVGLRYLYGAPPSVAGAVSIMHTLGATSSSFTSIAKPVLSRAACDALKILVDAHAQPGERDLKLSLTVRELSKVVGEAALGRLCDLFGSFAQIKVQSSTVLSFLFLIRDKWYMYPCKPDQNSQPGMSRSSNLIRLRASRRCRGLSMTNTCQPHVQGVPNACPNACRTCTSAAEDGAER